MPQEYQHFLGVKDMFTKYLNGASPNLYLGDAQTEEVLETTRPFLRDTLAALGHELESQQVGKIDNLQKKKTVVDIYKIGKKPVMYANPSGESDHVCLNRWRLRLLEPENLYATVWLGGRYIPRHAQSIMWGLAFQGGHERVAYYRDVVFSAWAKYTNGAQVLQHVEGDCTLLVHVLNVNDAACDSTFDINQMHSNIAKNVTQMICLVRDHQSHLLASLSKK